MPALIVSSWARDRLWSVDPEDFSLGEFNDHGNSRLSAPSTSMDSNSTLHRALESDTDFSISRVPAENILNNMIPSRAWYLASSIPTSSLPWSSHTSSIGVHIANANDEVRRRVMPRYWEFCENYGAILYLWARGFSSWTITTGTPNITTIQDLNSLLQSKNERSMAEAVELLENYFRERVASHPQYKVHPNNENFPPMLEPFCKMLAKVEMVPERTLWARLIDYHTGLSISSIAEGLHGNDRLPDIPEYLLESIDYRLSDLENEDEDEIPSVSTFSLSPPGAPIRSPILQEDRYSPYPTVSREHVQLSSMPTQGNSWPVPTSRSFPHPSDTFQPLVTSGEVSSSSSEDDVSYDFNDWVNLQVLANRLNRPTSRRRVSQRIGPGVTRDNSQWGVTITENGYIPIWDTASSANANPRTIAPEVLHSINPHTSSPAISPILSLGLGYQTQLNQRDLMERAARATRAAQVAQANHLLRAHMLSSVNQDLDADANVESDATSNVDMSAPGHSNPDEAASRPRQSHQWRTFGRSARGSTYRYRSRRSISYRAIAPRRSALEDVSGRNRQRPNTRDIPQEELHRLPPASERVQNQGPSASERENDLMNAFLQSAQSRRRENRADF